MRPVTNLDTQLGSIYPLRCHVGPHAARGPAPARPAARCHSALTPGAGNRHGVLFVWPPRTRRFAGARGPAGLPPAGLSAVQDRCAPAQGDSVACPIRTWSAPEVAAKPCSGRAVLRARGAPAAQPGGSAARARLARAAARPLALFPRPKLLSALVFCGGPRRLSWPGKPARRRPPPCTAARHTRHCRRRRAPPANTPPGPSAARPQSGGPAARRKRRYTCQRAAFGCLCGLRALGPAARAAPSATAAVTFANRFCTWHGPSC